MQRIEDENISIFHLIGNVGAGKGTQGDYLRERYTKPEYLEQGLIYGDIVMGDYFRAVAKRLPGSNDYRRVISDKSLELMSMGKVALDEDAMKVFMLAYSRHLDRGVNVLMVDGAPRSMPQQTALESFYGSETVTAGQPNPDVYNIVLDLHDSQAVLRLGGRLIEHMYGSAEHPEIAHLDSRQLRAKLLSEYPKALANGHARVDDDPKKWSARFDDYHGLTVPVIRYLDATSPKDRLIHIDAELPKQTVAEQIRQFIEPKLPHHFWTVQNGVVQPAHEDVHLWVPKFPAPRSARG